MKGVRDISPNEVGICFFLASTSSRQCPYLSQLIHLKALYLLQHTYSSYPCSQVMLHAILSHTDETITSVCQCKPLFTQTISLAIDSDSDLGEQLLYHRFVHDSVQ